jgi:hypothetical protein
MLLAALPDACTEGASLLFLLVQKQVHSQPIYGILFVGLFFSLFETGVQGKTKYVFDQCNVVCLLNTQIHMQSSDPKAAVKQ